VMVDQADYEKRETREFERGNFLTKIGPALTPDVPGLFPKLPAGAPRNRLTLAKWFFLPEQPLTARTAANRYWEQLFGTGIVETLENFGSVGEEPSHPELLDWLALHFQNDLHWDMKALLRELVTSATYRQSAKATPAPTERDPRNRLLAHGSQQRLTAEMVRDQALIASGLLSDTMGGPPVMPPRQQVGGRDWPQSLSAGDLHLYQAHQRLSQLSYLRCIGARCESGTPDTDQHSAASSGHAERSGVSGSFRSACAADDETDRRP
jgi:hypothetical protein